MIVLLSFIFMVFALMTFFPQGNINGASTLIPQEKQGSIYWLIVCLIIIAIPTLAFLVIKCKGRKKENCLEES